GVFVEIHIFCCGTAEYDISRHRKGKREAWRGRPGSGRAAWRGRERGGDGVWTYIIVILMLYYTYIIVIPMVSV
ncbi:MAG: hypothetical protein J6X88_09980, partial [Bacteroidales bacterium]|nr:hypothetical protein [Bacteroidales bacterium]